MRYAGTQAPTGQTSAHVPQSLHAAGLMTERSASSVIAFSGHSTWQAPQAMHSSVTLWLTISSSVQERPGLYTSPPDAVKNCV
jgi:hypothetical protein